MGYWSELGTALAASTVCLTVLGFIGKTTVEKWLERRFKKTDDITAKEFAQFKAALDSFNSRNQAQYNYLFPKQADAANEILNLCRDLEIKINRFLEMVGQDRRGRISVSEERLVAMSNVAFNAYADTTRMQMNNRRHFPKDFDKQIDAMLDLAFDITMALPHYDEGKYADLKALKKLVAGNCDGVEEGYRQIVGNAK